MNWLRANRLSAKNPLESPAYDLNMRSSVEIKRNPHRSVEPSTIGKIKSNPSFSISKTNAKTVDENCKKCNYTAAKQIKLPLIKRNSKVEENP